MTNIDWTKAPKGATHYDPEYPGGECWHMYDDGQWFVWIGCWDDCGDWATASNVSRLIPRPTHAPPTVKSKLELSLNIEVELSVEPDMVVLNGIAYRREAKACG